ncbi:carcinoembryonic antigen-related cell adhesion molecule 5-like [Chanodichthys erythropterus]|uniref:carcinoembryonic antigen-related cell adhesion molecule 5-like n=1 Tax=Chanodichthys erythropterus TaxID=933992 RepID=UPI00351E0D08
MGKSESVFGATSLAPVTVMEGDSVTLNSDLTEMKYVDVIQWTFEGTLIVEINVTADSFTVYDDVLDGRFRDRLKLDNHTGSLTITDITTEHAGDYSVRYILANYPMMKTFILTVYVESVSVIEGDSVTLNSDLTEMKDDDVILWTFGYENTLIAGINKQFDRFTVYDDVLDGRFRDRLKLDNQTGSLTITNITTEHAGDYSVRYILANYPMMKTFILTVYVKEGDSVTLNSDLTEMKDDDVIQWRFNNTLIAEINKQANRFTVYDDVLDGRFRDRLKLDNQTGSLTITDITTEHDGPFLLQIIGEKKSIKSFRIVVIDVFGHYGYLPMLVVVTEGDSVTLNSDLTEMKDDDEIQWRFNKTLIAEINKRANRFTVYDDVLDGRFRDRLKLDNQTGSLTITDTTTEHDGPFLLKIIGGKKSIKSFRISVNDVFGHYGYLPMLVVVTEGDSVTLNSDLTEMKDDDEIQWRFNKTLIAEINKRANRFTVYDDVLDGRLRDRLKLDNQTGSLTIADITTENAGPFLLKIIGEKKSINSFRIVVIARLPVPVISSNSSQCSSSSSSCSLVCSAVNVSHVTLSWYKGNSLLSSISVSDLSISLSLPLEVEYQDKNTYSCVLNNPISNQTQHLDITHLCHTCSVKSVSVMEGDSVTLESGTEIQKGDMIEWRFPQKSPSEFTPHDVFEELKRDSMKVDPQTRSLTLINVRTEDSGLYTLQITRNSREITYRYNVTVYASTTSDSQIPSGPSAGSPSGSAL